MEVQLENLILNLLKQVNLASNSLLLHVYTSAKKEGVQPGGRRHATPLPMGAGLHGHPGRRVLEAAGLGSRVGLARVHANDTDHPPTATGGARASSVRRTTSLTPVPRQYMAYPSAVQRGHHMHDGAGGAIEPWPGS